MVRSACRHPRSVAKPLDNLTTVGCLDPVSGPLQGKPADTAGQSSRSPVLRQADTWHAADVLLRSANQGQQRGIVTPCNHLDLCGTLVDEGVTSVGLAGAREHHASDRW